MTQRTPKITASPYFLPLALGLLGFGINYFNIPLFFGVDFLFGSIPALLAVALFGVTGGVLAAAVAGSYTYLLWDHPYAWIILLGEALFVGLMLRKWRGHLLLFTAFYWILLGMPLAWLFYRLALGTDTLGAALIMLKQGVNGIFNGLIASLILTYTPAVRWARRSEERRPTLQQILFNLLVAMVMVPTLTIMILDGHREMQRVESEIRSQLRTSSSDIRNHLNIWLAQHLQPVAELARRAEREDTRIADLQDEVRILHESFPQYHTLVLLDADGIARAASPLQGAGGERLLGQNFSDRPYYQRMRTTRRPYISEVFMGRGVVLAPTVTLGVPILEGGTFSGVAVGGLSLPHLSEMMKGYTDETGVEAILMDRRMRVIAGTPADLKPMEAFRLPAGGRPRWLSRTSFRWQPDTPGVPTMTRWKQSLYGRVVGLDDAPWSVVVLAPVAPYQSYLQGRYIQRLSFLLALSFLSLALSAWLAYRLSHPLRQLAETTRDLPNRLGENEPIPWPKSGVRELTSLIGNFQVMVGSLQRQFNEIQNARDALEERSRELAEKNDSLNAEIRERERAEEALTQRARLAACGEEISTILARGDSLSRILQDCVETLMKYLDVTYARIWTLNEAESVLESRARAGLPPKTSGTLEAGGEEGEEISGDACERIPLGESLVGQIAAEGRPFFSNDLRRDARWMDAQTLEEEGVVSFCGHPLVVENRSIGVLVMCARRPIREEILNEIASIADGIAQCIQRKRAESALMESEQRFRALIEESSDAIALIDTKGNVRYASPSTQRVLGYTPEEVVGEHIFSHIHPDDLKQIRPAVNELEDHPRHQIRVEYRVCHKDGEWRWLEGTGTNLLDDPSVGAIVANYRDITDRKRLEERLQQRAEELAEANRRKDEFLAMLAHELRNPLGPVMNALYLLKQGEGNEAIQARSQEVIERQVRHMARLMDDLLDVSRITRGKVEIRPERLDLAELARNVAQDHRSILEGANLSLELAVPEESVWVEGDPTRLSQVLGNLLLNAVKFTDPGGRVTVQLLKKPETGQAEIAVRDTGIGIAPEMLPHVFDIFTQADRSLDRSRGGLGLGLALVRGLVHLHGGTVQAHSEGLGRGTAFTVTLPLAEPPVKVSQTAVPDQPAPGALRLLIVEDNPDAAHSLRDLLRHRGHQVHVEHSGPEGLQAALNLHPDVVLCDLGLPGMDGYAVAAVLRKHFGNIGLVALSGYGREEDRKRSQAVGFDRHLVKPVNPEVLEQVLADFRPRHEK